ncbi:MAG: dTDP-glucose 4,6-dehydratase [Tannerellaceae bacterium]|jgi:dTDP-glucose 4,6-dehydratase|nr:dTDP-glucose 4,6-dehydratase [Tannerellaceae bacterium]
MKTYLITGGAGFIGANFVKHMLATYTDSKIIILDALTYAGNRETIEEDLIPGKCELVHGNICDSALVDSLFREHQFDCVVNFAAESHVDRSISNPQLFLLTNILGTQNLLDACRRAWVTGKDGGGYPIWRENVRFHQVSTDEVYGSLSPNGDDKFTESTPIDPRSPYSASKASADLFVQAYYETYKMPVSITRCSNNYGPYHFPEKLLPLIISNILEGKPLPIYGNGTNVRDWLYVEDHCTAIDAVIHRGRTGQVYNVGGNNEIQNIDIVNLTIQTMRNIMTAEPEYRKALRKEEYDTNGNQTFDYISSKLIQYVPDRLGHDLRYAIDATKIKNELGWTPQTDFANGLTKTIYWFLKNQTWVETVTKQTDIN